MIAAALIALGLALVTALMALFPDVAPPELSDHVASMSGIADHVGWLNKYFPVTETMALLGVLMSVYVGVSAVRFIAWVWSKVPVVGGGE